MPGHRAADCQAELVVRCFRCLAAGHAGDECPQPPQSSEHDHYFLLLFDALLVRAIVAVEYAKRGGGEREGAHPLGLGGDPRGPAGGEPWAPWFTAEWRIQALLDEIRGGGSRSRREGRKLEFQRRAQWAPWFAALEAVAELLLAEVDLGHGRLQNGRAKLRRAEELWASGPAAVRPANRQTCRPAAVEALDLVDGEAPAGVAFGRGDLRRGGALQMLQLAERRLAAAQLAGLVGPALLERLGAALDRSVCAELGHALGRLEHWYFSAEREPTEELRLPGLRTIARGMMRTILEVEYRSTEGRPTITAASEGRGAARTLVRCNRACQHSGLGTQHSWRPRDLKPL
jgi:hypothetical protein